ncbi:MAG: hypothetical protein U0575_06905 [Phycisphaerales bacterium]
MTCLSCLSCTIRTSRLFRTSTTLACTLVGLALVACTTRTAEFPGRSPEVVWTAMKVVAAEPRYDDWIVFENDYYADEATRCIDVYRHLRRDVNDGGGTPTREDQTYKLRMCLGATGEGVPEVTFASRAFAMPADAWSEADRYFAEVRSVLDAAGTGPAARPAESTPTR